MGLNTTEFESFEQQFIELVGDFNLISSSENHIREALRNEAARAEAAEAARDAAARSAADSAAAAAAASAGAAQAAKILSATQDELVTAKMQFEFADRQRALFEEKCSEMSNKINSLEKELQQLRPLQSAHSTLQRQFIELQERIQNATNDARSEASKLENELRRVEKCASAGTELRERARLAAAAHARERRLAAAELKHTLRELQTANAEVIRLGNCLAEMQSRLTKQKEETASKTIDAEPQVLAEVRAALEAEKSGTARLERALAAALADNATLAAELHKADNNNIIETQGRSTECSPATNICPIDSFLAE